MTPHWGDINDILTSSVTINSFVQKIRLGNCFLWLSQFRSRASLKVSVSPTPLVTWTRPKFRLPLVPTLCVQTHPVFVPLVTTPQVHSHSLSVPVLTPCLSQGLIHSAHQPAFSHNDGLPDPLGLLHSSQHTTDAHAHVSTPTDVNALVPTPH